MFRPHPLTGDVTRVFDYDSVTQAIKVIIYTEFFERPFSSQQIASGVKSYLFEPNDALSRRELQEKISLSILRYEPRVILKNVSVNYDRENPNGVTVTITYKIRTFERTETFSLFLERV
jgi:phage baseplate assembly protein W